MSICQSILKILEKEIQGIEARDPFPHQTEAFTALSNTFTFPITCFRKSRPPDIHPEAFYAFGARHKFDKLFKVLIEAMAGYGNPSRC